MTFKLSSSVQVGNKIKTNSGWRKVKSVLIDRVTLSDGFVMFGETIYGFKNK